MATGFEVVTGGNYPPAIQVGQCVYNGDTKKPEWWDGEKWSSLPPPAGDASVFTTPWVDTGKKFGSNFAKLAQLCAVDTDGNGVWVAIARDGYASRSADNGATWQELPKWLNSGLNDIEGRELTDIKYGTDGVWVVSTGYAFQSAKSTDNGLTWQSMNIVNVAGQISAIATDKAGTWLTVGSGGDMYNISVDNGATWAPVGLGGAYGDFYDIATSGSGPGSKWLAVDRYAYTSLSNNEDPTQGFITLEPGLNTPAGSNDEFQSADGSGDVWVVLGKTGYASRSIDGGETWTALPQGLNSGLQTANFNVVRTNDNGTWIALGDSGFGSISSDNGETWTALPQGLNSGSTSADFFGLSGDNNGNWIAVSISGHASISNDDGATWTALERSLGTGSEMFSPTGYIIDDSIGVWLAFESDGVIQRSVDKGDTWAQYEAEIPTYGVGKTNDGSLMFIVGGTVNDTRMMKSTDKGETFTYVDTLPGIGVMRSIDTNNNGVWLASGDLGVIIRSTDNGETWTQLDSSNTSNYTTIKHQSGTRWVGGSDNGEVFDSPDDGESWWAGRYSDGFNASDIGANDIVYVCGKYGAIWKYAGGWSGVEIVGNKIASSYYYPNRNILSIVYLGDNKWVACGAEGEIVTSADNGLSWLDQGRAPTYVSSENIMFRMAGHSDGNVIVVGPGGEIFTGKM